MKKKVTKKNWAVKAGKNQLKLKKVKEGIQREKLLGLLEEMITSMVAGNTAEADIKLHEYMTIKGRIIINEDDESSEDKDDMDDSEESDDDMDDSEESDDSDVEDDDMDDSEESDDSDVEDDDMDDSEEDEDKEEKVTESAKLKAKNLRNASKIKKRTK